MIASGDAERKKNHSQASAETAVVIAAFGSSRRGKAALDLFRDSVAAKFQNHRVYWGYTSSIIRRKTGNPGLEEALAQVEADGFRQAVVLPLQIFPGPEYRGIYEKAHGFSALRVVVGETLMHHWKFMEDVLRVVEQDFLAPEKGLNLLALHGTALTADPVNSTYLGLDRLVRDKYVNVSSAALEGVPDRLAVFEKLAREQRGKRSTRLRIIPLLYIAGLHVEDDLMGAENSWKSHLEKLGFSVECPTVEYGEERLYKSLASYPEIHQLFLQRLEHSLARISHQFK